MTTSEYTATPPPVADLDAVLVVLREHAVALACSVSNPPSRVRLEATGASGAVVELGWAPAGPEWAPAHPVTFPTRPAPAETSRPGSPDASVETTGTPGHRIAAPTVGTFHRAPEPQAAPFVTEGDVVAAGQQVGIVEAMKLMIPVEAGRAGRIVEVLCGDGEPVEYGQALFVIDAP